MEACQPLKEGAWRAGGTSLSSLVNESFHCHHRLKLATGKQKSSGASHRNRVTRGVPGLLPGVSVSLDWGLVAREKAPEGGSKH